MLESPVLAREKLEDLKDFSSFEFVKVLSENCGRKKICVEGKFKGKDDRAIIIFEETGFSEANIKELISDKFVEIRKTFENDIYRNFEVFTNKESVTGIKTTIIYPASDHDINKHKSFPTYIISETSEIYFDLTLPFVERELLSNLQWVYDKIDNKLESDDIVYEDKCPVTGFILVPHLTWDKNIIDDLHLVAIVRPHGIKSIRDLNEKHIPLLKNIKTSVLKFIEEKYGLKSDQVIGIFHYLPSYFHLHVHFANIKCETAGATIDEAHLLTDVIENIELVSDYYQKMVIPFTINETNSLLTLYKDKGLVEEPRKIDFEQHSTSASTGD